MAGWVVVSSTEIYTGLEWITVGWSMLSTRETLKKQENAVAALDRCSAYPGRRPVCLCSRLDYPGIFKIYAQSWWSEYLSELGSL